MKAVGGPSLGWRADWGVVGSGRGFVVEVRVVVLIGSLGGELVGVCRCGCGVPPSVGAVWVGASVVEMVGAKPVPGVVVVTGGVGVGGGGVVIQEGGRQEKRQAWRVGRWGGSDSVRLLLERGACAGGRRPRLGSLLPQ